MCAGWIPRCASQSSMSGSCSGDLATFVEGLRSAGLPERDRTTASDQSGSCECGLK
jgi:hypothetical protein